MGFEVEGVPKALPWTSLPNVLFLGFKPKLMPKCTLFPHTPPGEGRQEGDRAGAKTAKIIRKTKPAITSGGGELLRYWVPRGCYRPHGCGAAGGLRLERRVDTG